MRVSLAVRLTVASALCAVVAAVAIPILDPPPYSTDLRPGLALGAGVALISAIWVATFARWIVREIRRR